MALSLDDGILRPRQAVMKNYNDGGVESKYRTVALAAYRNGADERGG
jgi:hypothetical protein